MPIDLKKSYPNHQKEPLEKNHATILIKSSLDIQTSLELKSKILIMKKDSSRSSKSSPRPQKVPLHRKNRLISEKVAARLIKRAFDYQKSRQRSKIRLLCQIFKNYIKPLSLRYHHTRHPISQIINLNPLITPHPFIFDFLPFYHHGQTPSFTQNTISNNAWIFNLTHFKNAVHTHFHLLNLALL